MIDNAAEIDLRPSGHTLMAVSTPPPSISKPDPLFPPISKPDPLFPLFTYVDCWTSSTYDPNDPNTFVEITAQLNPPCTAEEVEWVLFWTGGEPHPTDRRKRLVPKDIAARTTVIATAGTSSFSVDVVVAKIDWIKVSDQNVPTLTRTNPPDANDLYIPEADPFGWGYVHLWFSYSPSDAGMYIVGKVEGDVAIPDGGVVGDYAQPIPIWLIPTGGNRTYTIKVGVDRDGSLDLGEGDCGELDTTVHVVKVDLDLDSNNDGSIDSVDDPIEDDPNLPGKLIHYGVGGQGVTAELCVEGAPSDTGRWMLSWSPSDDLYVKASPNSHGELIDPNHWADPNDWYPMSQMPSSVYVVAASPTVPAGNTRLSLKVLPEPGSAPFEDHVRATAFIILLKSVSYFGDGQQELKKTGTGSYKFSVDGFSSDGDTVITNPVWLDNNGNGDASDTGDVSDPVCFLRGSTIQLTAVLMLGPDLPTPVVATVRTTSGGDVLKEWPVVLEGAQVEITEPNFSTIPDAYLTDEIGGTQDWELQLAGDEYARFGENKYEVYTIYAAPDPNAGSVTANRVDWAVGDGGTAFTTEAVADLIWVNLAGDPPYDPCHPGHPTVAIGWELMDANSTVYGWCNQQADLMVRAMNIVGISASLELVYASTNAGAGNCLHPEQRPGSQYLILDFEPTGPDHNWNAFEGCCVTAGSYYAVWPSYKADNDYDMLLTLPGRQYWVETNDKDPGDPECLIISVLEEVPKP